jgi:hypothetical protein
VLAWRKPMIPIKPGVNIDCGWGPVYLAGVRRRGERGTVRDFLFLRPEQ